MCLYSAQQHSMWPAHVSFPIDGNLTDTRGAGSSLTLLFFQLRAIRKGAVVPNEKQSCHATVLFRHRGCGCACSSSSSSSVRRTGNVLFLKCLKTTANKGLNEKVKQQDKYNALQWSLK